MDTLQSLHDSASLALFLQLDPWDQEEVISCLVCCADDSFCDDIDTIYEKGLIGWSDFVWYDQYVRQQRLLNGKDKWRWAYLLNNCDTFTTTTCEENF